MPALERSLELYRRADSGDAGALAELFQRYRKRLRRIAGIQLGARLRSVLDEEEIAFDVLLAAHHGLGSLEPDSDASLLQWLARVVELQARRRANPTTTAARERPRQLRMTGAGGDEPDPRRRMRDEFERLVDSYVAELEPPELREVLLLRDYYGGDWEFVRERLGLLSAEAAQELYRRGHEKIARVMRGHLRRKA